MNTSVRAARRYRSALTPFGLCGALVLLAGAARADSSEPGPTPEEGRVQGLPLDAEGREKHNSGWTAAIDDDLFAPANRDSDYTGGAAVTLAGWRAAEWPITLDRLVGWIEPLVPGRRAGPPYFKLHAMQVGLLAFTPDDLNATVPIHDDRPYASLLFVSNSRTHVRHPLLPVYQTGVTVGILGLDLAKAIQRSIHEGLDLNDVPEGWDFQISDGGEPTIEVNWARHSLLSSSLQSKKSKYELEWSATANVGFITEGAAAVSLRWGRINTPWWSFTPERAEYTSRPAPVVGGAVQPGVRELYLWGGLEARARAYNVLLQGQFRDSEVTFSARQLNPCVGGAWLGVTWQVSRAYRVSYVGRYQTSEIEDGPGSRRLFWGGVLVSRGL